MAETLKEDYGIKDFVTDSVKFRGVTHTGKPWTDNDLILVRDALALVGAVEKGIIKERPTVFRRLSGANYKGLRGFYQGDETGNSVNFFDEALPFERGTWVGQDGTEHSYGIYTTLHELGHLLHYSKAIIAGTQTEYLDLFKNVVWARSGAKRNDSIFPPPNIILPTTYSKTGEPWKDFFADTYSIFVTNPRFLDTPEHNYLLAFFTKFQQGTL